MAKKEEVIHFDAIGRPLKVGDPVACANGKTTLLIGTTTSIGEKQIRVVNFGLPPKSLDAWGEMKINGKLRYSKEVILIGGEDVTMYLLRTIK